jgi:hypothetical protein
MVIELTGMEIANASLLDKVLLRLKQWLYVDVRTEIKEIMFVNSSFLKKFTTNFICFTNAF